LFTLVPMKKLAFTVLFLSILLNIFSQTTLELQREEGVTENKATKAGYYEPAENKFADATPKSVLNESFEGSQFPPFGWKVIDNDGDGHCFFRFSGGNPHTGNYVAASASWLAGTPLTPDNRLVTPALLPVTGDTLVFYYAPQDTSAPAEFLEVVASKTGTAVADFTDTLFSVILSDTFWIKKEISLDTFAGDTIYISFNHRNCTDNFYLNLDDIEGPAVYYAPDLAVKAVKNPKSGCNLGQETVAVEIQNMGQDTISQFDIAFKVDSGTFITEQYNGPPVMPFGSTNYTFTNKAVLSAPGHHQLTVKVIMPNDNNKTNDIKKVAVDHLLPKQIPYFNGFENDSANTGWNIIDANNDSISWHFITNGINPFNGTGYAFCNPPSADDWLITGCLSLSAGINYEVSFWIKTRISGNESVEVMIGQSNNPAALTTKIFDFTTTSVSYLKASDTFSVANTGTYYIGIRANGTNSSQPVYIDDFMVDDLFIGIKEPQAPTFSFSPNPATNHINIRNEEIIRKIEIISLTGQKLITARPNSTHYISDISKLESGVYMLIVHTDKSGMYKKLIVR